MRSCPPLTVQHADGIDRAHDDLGMEGNDSQFHDMW
jgi:hypothetical protein